MSVFIVQELLLYFDGRVTHVQCDQIWYIFSLDSVGCAPKTTLPALQRLQQEGAVRPDLSSLGNK